MRTIAEPHGCSSRIRGLREKSVGESVDEYVRGIVRLGGSLRKEPRQAHRLTGLSMLPPLIRVIDEADPEAFQPGFRSGDTYRWTRSTAIEPKGSNLVP